MLPPEGIDLAVPSAAEQVASVAVALATTFDTDVLIVSVAVPVQPLASVTVTVYIPAPKPVTVAPFCGGEVFQAYEYGVAPPEAEACNAPLVAVQMVFDALVVTVIVGHG